MHVNPDDLKNYELLANLFYFGFSRHTRYEGVSIGTGQSIRQYNRDQLVIEIHEPPENTLIGKGK